MDPYPEKLRRPIACEGEARQHAFGARVGCIVMSILSALAWASIAGLVWLCYLVWTKG